MPVYMQRLRQLRDEHKLSQKELAQALNVTQTAITYWETGKREPSAEIIEKIAEYYGVNPAYIMGWSDTRALSQETVCSSKNTCDIEKILDHTREQLLSQEGLMFNGDPVSPEAIDSILSAMQIGMEMAKKKNKEKYTPKKYKDSKDNP